MRSWIRLSVALAGVILLAACASTSRTQQGAVGGATAGAVLGGVIGNASGDTATGALIGAAVGSIVFVIWDRGH